MEGNVSVPFKFQTRRVKKRHEGQSKICQIYVAQQDATFDVKSGTYIKKKVDAKSQLHCHNICDKVSTTIELDVTTDDQGNMTMQLGPVLSAICLMLSELPLPSAEEKKDGTFMRARAVKIGQGVSAWFGRASIDAPLDNHKTFHHYPLFFHED